MKKTLARKIEESIISTGAIGRKSPEFQACESWFNREVASSLLFRFSARYEFDFSRGAGLGDLLRRDYGIEDLKNFEHFASSLPERTPEEISAIILSYLVDCLGYEVSWTADDPDKFILFIRV